MRDGGRVTQLTSVLNPIAKLDPYQFAYRAHQSTEYAVTALVHHLLQHLDKLNISDHECSSTSQARSVSSSRLS